MLVWTLHGFIVFVVTVRDFKTWTPSVSGLFNFFQEKLARGLTWTRMMRSFEWILKPL